MSRMSRFTCCVVVLIAALLTGHARAQSPNPVKSKKTKPAAEEVISAKTPLADKQPGDAGVPAKPSYKLHKVLTPDEATSFVVNATKKQKVSEQLKVIKELRREKLAELERMEGTLERDYRILKDKKYDYKQEEKTVFLIEADAPRKSTYTIADEAEEKRFLRLLTAKKLTSGAVATLNLLILEKERELKSVEQQMNAQFNIVSSQNYFYQADVKALFLIQDPEGK
jgi:hypothetical protein